MFKLDLNVSLAFVIILFSCFCLLFGVVGCLKCSRNQFFGGTYDYNLDCLWEFKLCSDQYDGLPNIHSTLGQF